MNRSDQFPEVRAIADAVCINSATPEQLAELEQLLRGNFAAQQFYYDYIKMDTQLQSPADGNMELVYRRMTEEVIMRPKDSSITAEAAPKTDKISRLFTSTLPRTTPPNNKLKIATIIALMFLLLAGLIWQFINHGTRPIVAKIVQGHVAIIGQQGDINGNALFAGNYQTEQGATLQLLDGETLHLAPQSLMKIFNNNEIKLKRGKLTIEPSAKYNTIVHGQKFVLNSTGNGLTFDLTHPSPRVTSGKKTVLIPSRWRPNHFWGFDGNSDRVIDSAGSAHGIASSGAIKTTGFVGQGAVMFNNSADARIEIGSGGGTAPGTGSFAVSDGVTIEALIRPEYSGEFGELDEIFRKDHGDSELRMLLSFQHDQGKRFLKPKGDVKESLSFGLNILGQGYHELKLPLDGKNGRPTLTELKDGNFHHVAATYNVKTGLKAIYINGQRLASYQYPPGSKMLSGGPGSAAIGNNPAPKLWHREAFAGVIDELAFYDFALPEYVINNHLKNIQQGNNYFGLPANAQPLTQQLKLTLPPLSVIEIDAVTGLPVQIIIPKQSITPK